MFMMSEPSDREISYEGLTVNLPLSLCGRTKSLGRHMTITANSSSCVLLPAVNQRVLWHLFSLIFEPLFHQSHSSLASIFHHIYTHTHIFLLSITEYTCEETS